MKTKKGITEMWMIIMSAILAILIVILIIIWFKGSGEKGFGDVNKKIGGLSDCDGDHVADLFDKCKCDASIGDTFPKEVTACGVSCDTTPPFVCVQ